VSADAEADTVVVLQLEGRIRELSSVEQRLRDVELRLEQERGQWLLERTELSKRLGVDASNQPANEVNTGDDIFCAIIYTVTGCGAGATDAPSPI